MTKDTDSNTDDITNEIDKTDAPSSLRLCIQRSIFVEADNEIDMIESSNLPFVEVEDSKHWKSFKTEDGNPNLIGQIHFMNKDENNTGYDSLEPKLHLCYNPGGKVLTKVDLQAIIKVMENLEQFKIDKSIQHEKTKAKN